MKTFRKRKSPTPTAGLSPWPEIYSMYSLYSMYRCAARPKIKFSPPNMPQFAVFLCIQFSLKGKTSWSDLIRVHQSVQATSAPLRIWPLNCTGIPWIPRLRNQLHIVHVGGAESMCVFWLNFGGKVGAWVLGACEIETIETESTEWTETSAAQPWDRIEFSVARQATNFCDPCGHATDPHQPAKIKGKK